MAQSLTTIAVPPTLSLPLIHLAPLIRNSRRFLQLSSWTAPTWYHSWVALAAWWAACLLLPSFLPLVAAAAVLVVQRTPSSDAPVLESDLRAVIADITLIQALLPAIPCTAISSHRLARIAAILYIPYLVTLRFVAFRTFFALLGTVLFTWRAPWATVIRTVLWRSAYVRRSVYAIWALVSGEPAPATSPSIQAISEEEEEKDVQSLRFLFTIYENQRWWMGLDWTAALLPGERPSWCTTGQVPISPPNAFSLPDTTTIYLSDGKGGRLKRTAIWKWEEPEWRVIVHKDQGGLTRIERPLPSLKEETPNNSRFMKTAGRFGTGSSAAPNDNSIKMTGSSDGTAAVEDVRLSDEDDILTDSDGWIYGDNKWENQSNKGGMGKYTRHRRWTRIAAVYEVVEVVEPGALSAVEDARAPDSASPDPTPDIPQTNTPDVPVTDAVSSNPPESPLRQRLRQALKQQ